MKITYYNIVGADEATNDEWLANFDTIDSSIDIDSVGAEDS